MPPHSNSIHSSSSTDDACIDAEGCCSRHPIVQLRRKKAFGGWRILLDTCPLCSSEGDDDNAAADLDRSQDSLGKALHEQDDTPMSRRNGPSNSAREEKQPLPSSSAAPPQAGAQSTSTSSDLDRLLSHARQTYKEGVSNDNEDEASEARSHLEQLISKAYAEREQSAAGGSSGVEPERKSHLSPPQKSQLPSRAAGTSSRRQSDAQSVGVESVSSAREEKSPIPSPVSKQTKSSSEEAFSSALVVSPRDVSSRDPSFSLKSSPPNQHQQSRQQQPPQQPQVNRNAVDPDQVSRPRQSSQQHQVQQQQMHQQQAMPLTNNNRSSVSTLGSGTLDHLHHHAQQQRLQSYSHNHAEADNYSMQDSLASGSYHNGHINNSRHERSLMSGDHSSLANGTLTTDGSASDQKKKKKTSSSTSKPKPIVCLPTNEYDKKGRCVRHPHIRLRKKKFMRGWKVVLNNCPDCCALNMKRQAAADKRSKKKKKEARRKLAKKEEERRKERENKPPIPTILETMQVTPIPSQQQQASKTRYGVSRMPRKNGDDASSISSGTETTASNSWRSYGSRKSANRVTKMPYTDAFGDRGWYTGEVNDEGRPHGKGSIKYYNGIYYEGKWINGMSHSALMKERQLQEAGRSAAAGSRLHAQAMSVMNQTSQQQRRVVCSMRYTDYNGQSGSYTGEVNASNRPDGKGSMRYDSGAIAEGEWFDGMLDDESGSVVSHNSYSKSVASRISSRSNASARSAQSGGFLPSGMCGGGGVGTEGRSVGSIGSLRSLPNFQSGGYSSKFGGNQSLSGQRARYHQDDASAQDLIFRLRGLEP